jgi:predicted transcriptional regulator
MNVELTTEDQSRLAQLAEATQRPAAEIAHEVMHWFLMQQEQSFAAAVQEGDDDFARGDTIEQHEVVAQFADVLRHR